MSGTSFRYPFEVVESYLGLCVPSDIDRLQEALTHSLSRARFPVCHVFSLLQVDLTEKIVSGKSRQCWSARIWHCTFLEIHPYLTILLLQHEFVPQYVQLHSVKASRSSLSILISLKATLRWLKLALLHFDKLYERFSSFHDSVWDWELRWRYYLFGVHGAQSVEGIRIVLIPPKPSLWGGLSRKKPWFND